MHYSLLWICVSNNGMNGISHVHATETARIDFTSGGAELLLRCLWLWATVYSTAYGVLLTFSVYEYVCLWVFSGWFLRISEHGCVFLVCCQCEISCGEDVLWFSFDYGKRVQLISDFYLVMVYFELNNLILLSDPVPMNSWKQKYKKHKNQTN